MFKPFIKSVLCASVIMLAFQMTNISAFAQSSSAISPWMGMLDRSRSASGLDNYNRLVKPRQDMLRSYANQASQIQAQQRALRAMQNAGSVYSSPSSGGVQRDLLNTGVKDGRGQTMVLAAPREIPSSQSPATFNQYMHYYPAGGLPRQPVPNFSNAGGRR